MAVTINGGTGVTIGSGAAYTFGDGSTQTAASDPADFAFKNRIINGAMVISQRNGTTSVNVSGVAYAYQMDRFYCGGLNGVATPFTLQQVSDAPTGFVNSTKITVANTDALSTASTEYGFQQSIEANNVSDFNLGSANAVAVTLSFWVKSSLPGTFGLGIRNAPTFNRSYVATYTINAANTWEQKTVSLTMDTTGTWSTSGTGAGLNITWSLGCGTNFNGTANTWNATGAVQTSGSVKLVSNAAATWQITGVQLEKNPGATGFDVRPYGTELSLCQRYCYRIDGAASASIATGAAQTAAIGIFTLYFPVQARVAPTGIVASSAWILNNFGPGSSGTTTPSFLAATTNGMTITIGGGGSMNVGSAGQVYSSGAAGYIYTSGSEL